MHDNIHFVCPYVILIIVCGLILLTYLYLLVLAGMYDTLRSQLVFHPKYMTAEGRTKDQNGSFACSPLGMLWPTLSIEIVLSVFAPFSAVLSFLLNLVTLSFLYFFFSSHILALSADHPIRWALTSTVGLAVLGIYVNVGPIGCWDI